MRLKRTTALSCTARVHGTEPLASGENNGKTKVSDSQVEEIRRLHRGGMLQKDIAEMFEIDAGHVSAVINFKKRKNTKKGNNSNGT